MRLLSDTVPRGENSDGWGSRADACAPCGFGFAESTLRFASVHSRFTAPRFSTTVKHPVYNEQGEITGYVAINAADNVSTTVTLKYGTDANTQSWASAEGTSFAPNALPFDENTNVLYYKAEVKIGAK